MPKKFIKVGTSISYQTIIVLDILLIQKIAQADP